MHMKKIVIKIIKKDYLYKKDLLKDLRMSLLSFNFVIINVIYKILVLPRNHLNYLKDDIFECFFKKCDRLSFFLKKSFFHNI